MLRSFLFPCLSSVRNLEKSSTEDGPEGSHEQEKRVVDEIPVHERDLHAGASEGREKGGEKTEVGDEHRRNAHACVREMAWQEDEETGRQERKRDFSAESKEEIRAEGQEG